MKTSDTPYVDALHVFILFAFAVGQPLLDVLSRNPTFFIAHRAGRNDILAFVAIVMLVLPSLLVLAQFLIGRLSSLWRRALHVSTLAVLVYLASLVPLKRAVARILGNEIVGTTSGTIADLAILAVAAVVSVSLIVLYVRYAKVRGFVTWLSPGIVLFPAMFVFVSPVSNLISSPPPNRSPVESASGAANEPSTIVMVVFDEFNGMSLLDERHEIDPARYPRLAELAGHATWFRNATTSDAWTIHAVPSMLTGKRPDHSLEPYMADHPENLFTLLANTHQLDVTECVTGLCRPMTQPMPVRMRNITQLLVDAAVVYARVVTPEGQAHVFPGIGGRWGDFVELGQNAADSGDDPIRYHEELGRFRKFVENIRSNSGPALHYLHIMLPHVPYRYLPSGRAYRQERDIEDDLIGLKPHEKAELVAWRKDEFAVLQAQQRYLLQLGCVDRLVGELVDRLKALGIYEDSTIVLTSDHGVSFRAGQSRRGLTQATAADIAPILLIVKAPRQTEGVVSDRNVESIDILPTIADLQGLSVPWSTDGQSAVDPDIPEREEKITLSRDVRLVFSGAFPERFESAAQHLKHFSDGRDPANIFRIGPNASLVGRKVDEFPSAATSEIAVRVETPAADSGNDGVLLDCLVRGRVERAAEHKSPVVLAIAVNGTIQAVTRTYLLEGREDTWSAMLPEEAVAVQPVDYRIYLVEVSGGTVTLIEPRR